MTIFSAGFQIYQTTNATPACDFVAGSSNYPRFLEFGAQVGAAAVTTFGIGRSPTASLQLGGQALLCEDKDNPIACQTTWSTQWLTPPTVPTQYIRRLAMSGGAIGQSMIVTFPRGLKLASGGSLVFWNLTTTQAVNSSVWAILDE